jgi:hypothetical protein
MRDFKKDRSIRSGKGDRRHQYARMVGGLGVMAALALLAFGTAHAAWDMYQKFSEASSADEAAQGELVTMQAQYQNISTTTDALQTDRGLEAAIRTRYGVGRPGEGEIDIIRQASTTNAAGGTDTSWWARLWRRVFIW